MHQETEAPREQRVAFANTQQVGASSRTSPAVLVQLLLRPAGRHAIPNTHRRAGQ